MTVDEGPTVAHTSSTEPLNANDGANNGADANADDNDTDDNDTDDSSDAIDSDDDSAVEISYSDSTASLTDSIFDYPKIHNRTYHATFGNALYWFATSLLPSNPPLTSM